ncbi:Lrp/AsnC family transcriptional regulator [Kineosporia sp. J2-2]|uniref:Lrp/AsnC family transcriptional regulator n=1 Tax=Kineosporia corallincola TaxID=2835133 RepID=A0ABS5TLI0_9ACTN|nr:Lrp/AsnC family transcriptional regulator [Kineosporia corallincola]MBT0771698.1 Lrp/AsnC family transcriptional regulator [Kineosporia corallincola]
MANDRRPGAGPRGTVAAELDDIDRAILSALTSDARMPNNALAAQVGVAPSTCLMRVRRLQDAGVIRGFRAELSPAALGRPLQALVAVRLATPSRHRIGAFAREMAELPGVLNVFFLGGANDFQVHIAVETPDALRDFVVRHLSARREVAFTETNVIFEHVTGGIGPAGPTG